NNPAYTQMGMAINNVLKAKKEGVKFIVVDPMYTQTAEMLANKYIPIRPATDTPLLLSIAYVLLKEDNEENKYIDWDFIKRCSVGFNKETMPEGIDEKENFMDYLLGTYDQVPKTPEWASEICG